MKKEEIETPRENVLRYYPKAEAINVKCKNGDYYHITNGNYMLGQGKTAKAAWMAAHRNTL